MAFRYPDTPLRRRHGPSGYVNYESYKPWLRDEFLFRCVYCLRREAWFPDGKAAFGVDHLRPQAIAPGRRTDYENLLYACGQCNSFKANAADVPDPCEVAFGEDVEVQEDGTIRWRTSTGKLLVKACSLDRAPLNDNRRLIIELLALMANRRGP